MEYSNKKGNYWKRKLKVVSLIQPAKAVELNNNQNLFNNTEVPYPKEKTIVDLFETQVAKTPNHIALHQYAQQMSYTILNQRANQLAHFLITKGVKQGDNIGLITARSFDMIIGMYAILKAGCAYVPIDPEYPIDRQQYILQQSSINFLVTDIVYPLSKEVNEVQLVSMDSINLSNYSAVNLGLIIDSQQLAYTIYTSGSTGKPKGVMVAHSSVVNLILWVNNTFNIGADDRLLFITSMCFDLSVYDIFGMLASGGAIVIADNKQVKDISKLSQLIEEYKITFWDSVPTTLDYLVRSLESKKETYQLQSLRLIFLSGDWIPVSLPKRIKPFFANAQVVGLGGATEGTVWSNYYPISNKDIDKNWKSIPYGKPINNTTYYILDEQLQPTPNGEVGELFIGGVGVAKGYAGDIQKTKASFLNDPYDKDGGKMYRTGDLGKMLPDGNMEFIGRKDNQVKIRGYRVELGEIEHTIVQWGGSIVEAAVVIAAKDIDNNNCLIAYVVAPKGFQQNECVAFLRSQLPEYMIPAFWETISFLPLTENGKIDKKALPKVDIAAHKIDNLAEPVTETEKILVAIWQDVLGIKKLGIDNNFFELGGQSLIAVQLITGIEKKLKCELNIYTLFKYPTIRELALCIDYEIYDNLRNTDRSQPVWRSLIPIKPNGNKTPLYIVHGDGLNIENFKNLSDLLDAEQPVYSLQPLGLTKDEVPIDNLIEIAQHYISEIIEQNPTGPYSLAGYSFGGYVAIEMSKLLKAMGKQVHIIGIFDLDAENVNYNKNWWAKLPKRIKRQVPKFLFLLKSIYRHPKETYQYQMIVFKKRLDKIAYKMGLKTKPDLEGFDAKLKTVNEHHIKALREYQLLPFDDTIYLFKAKKRIYFVDDFKYLGWKKYALKGVKVIEVPGDHKTMFLPPNVKVFARLLQDVLDSSSLQ